MKPSLLLLSPFLQAQDMLRFPCQHFAARHKLVASPLAFQLSLLPAGSKVQYSDTRAEYFQVERVTLGVLLPADL
jgi:hypothetical protein